MTTPKPNLPTAKVTRFFAKNAQTFSRGNRVEHASGVKGTVLAIEDSSTLIVEWESFAKAEAAPAENDQLSLF
jgi:hypothetical protein